MGFRILALALIAWALGAADLEVVHQFNGPMPTGVSVSKGGRIFVNYPRWGDPVEFTVAEIRNGKEVPYPNAEINRADPATQGERLISVQSVVIDARDRLWIVDTGSVQFAKVSYGGPKLVCVDLTQNRVVKRILIPEDIAVPETYLNDVRFDLSRGKEGYAYITDSGQGAPNGIIVVDLESGKSWRRLANHHSVKPDPRFIPVVEGQELVLVSPAGEKSRWALGSDGIAIDTARKRLYYSPLTSRHLFSVSLDAISDQAHSDADVARTVVDLGDKGGASDGLDSDSTSRLYATDYEHNLVRRRTLDGKWETLAQDARMLWPDTLSIANGYVYVTCNQLHRQKQFHGGTDFRQKPYYLFRFAQ